MATNSKVDTGIQLISFERIAFSRLRQSWFRKCFFENLMVETVETMKSQQDLKTDRSFRNHNIQPLYSVTTSCSLSVQFLDVPPFPWKPGLPNITVQALGSFCNHCSEQCVAFLKVCRCKRIFLQEADLRVLSLLMHGYAWNCMDLPFGGMCVSESPISTGGASKNNMTVIISRCIFCNFGHHLTYPAFLNLSFAA